MYLYPASKFFGILFSSYFLKIQFSNYFVIWLLKLRFNLQKNHTKKSLVSKFKKTTECKS